jgi:hypothetical protein
VFRFALVDADNAEALGVVAFARSDWKPGDVIPQARDSAQAFVHRPRRSGRTG